MYNTRAKEVKDNSLSLTGYRALLVLRSLIEYPKTRDELIEIFAKDKLFSKSLSKDTITNTINALKAVGCNIVKPNPRTDYRYVMIDHPFSVEICESQVNYLQELRKNIISLGDWQLIESVNKLYEKLIIFVKDKDLREKLKKNHPFHNIDKKVLCDLIRFSNVKKTVDIIYNSSKNGRETFAFIPDFIQFENEKLYVWGYSYKYDNMGYLRVDKIDAVNVIDFHDNSHILNEYYKKIPRVQYMLSGYSSYLFCEDRLQKIIKRTKSSLKGAHKESIIIEATVYSEFNFIQKLLSYGADCKILGPNDFKNRFIQKIKEMRTQYND